MTIPSTKTSDIKKLKKNSLLSVEYVNSDQMDLSVTVLASFGCGHLHNLAWATLEHHEAVFAQGRALHRECSRRTGVTGLEMCVLNVTHCVVLVNYGRE